MKGTFRERNGHIVGFRYYLGQLGMFLTTYARERFKVKNKFKKSALRLEIQFLKNWGKSALIALKNTLFEEVIS